MRFRKFPKVKNDDPIEPYHLNIIYRELERLNKMTGAGGITVANRDAGPVITGGDSDDWAWATCATTIGARTSADVTLYLDDRATTLGSATLTVFNASPDIIPAGVLLRVRLSSLTIEYWSCNAIAT